MVYKTAELLKAVRKWTESSEYWVWDDIAWQTVSEVTTGNAQLPTVENRVRWITSCENMTAGDSSDWSRRHTECSQVDAMVSGHADINKTSTASLKSMYWETAVSTKKIDISVCQQHWVPTEDDVAGKQEALYFTVSWYLLVNKLNIGITSAMLQWVFVGAYVGVAQ